MEKNEVQQLLKKIKGTYGNKFEINEFTVESWHELIGDQSLEETIKLFTAHALRDKFPPNVSDLKKAKQRQSERDVPMYVRPGS